jgi:hypothetical protein
MRYLGRPRSWNRALMIHTDSLMPDSCNSGRGMSSGCLASLVSDFSYFPITAATDTDTINETTDPGCGTESLPRPGRR